MNHGLFCSADLISSFPLSVLILGWDIRGLLRSIRFDHNMKTFKVQKNVSGLIKLKKSAVKHRNISVETLLFSLAGQHTKEEKDVRGVPQQGLHPW